VHGSGGDGVGEVTAAVYDSMYEKLVAYSRGRGDFGRPALRHFYEDVLDDIRPAEWEAPIAMGYLYHGYRDAAGRRLIDHFLAARGRSLSRAEAAAGLALQRAWASLFEVTAVQRGTGLELRDLSSGETHPIREVAATARLLPRTVLFAWLVTFPDHIELAAACAVPPLHVGAVRAAFESALAAARRGRPDLALREHGAELAPVIAQTLRAATRAFTMPALQTADGDPLVFCEARYTVTDPAAAHAALADIPTFEAADDASFAWLERGGESGFGRGSRTLGRVRLAGGELVLSTMSRERHARGRRMLEAVLGRQLQHREDSFQEAAAMVHSHRGRAPDVPGELLPDVAREVVGQYLRAHYRRWLDTPLPMLGGATPREATRTPAGRARVASLLDDIEHDAHRMEAGEAIAVHGLRHELGLTDEERTSRG
jgi:hypothetical protein